MKRFLILLVAVLLLIMSAAVFAQEGKKAEGAKEGQKPKGPPPSVVVTGTLEAGTAEPMSEFVGTIFFIRSSEVASEVDGKVERVLYREGDRMKKGQRLVILSSDLLSKNIESTEASYQQLQEQLEKAKKDLERIEPLYRDGSIAEAMYDDYAYKVKTLKSNADSVNAELERLKLQLRKKVIRAPYSGVVLSRSVETGEWVPPGGVVAVMADDSKVDAVVDVPERILGFLKKGRPVDLHSGGKALKGEIISMVPKGDVATRTFTVKIRLDNKAGLLEGMEVRAILPTGQSRKGLLINRDAVVNFAGMQVIYIVVEGMAKMIPVEVTGYDGMRASVQGPGLKDGMMVVVKGNERLYQGDKPVMVRNPGEAPGAAAPSGPDPRGAENR